MLLSLPTSASEPTSSMFLFCSPAHTHPRANQVNAHIMLSRTVQRRHHAALAMAMAVAPRAEGGGAVRVDDVGVRRLTVMFSSVCVLNGGDSGLQRFFRARICGFGPPWYFCP
jgi:hypothetical protein